MHDENEDIIREFLIEAHESVDRLDQELLQLEKDPHNAKILNSIFRIIHTIKGTCGFLGFSKLEAITHVGESLLDSLRSERLEMNDDIATALLELCDATRSILGAIETSRDEGPKAYTELAAKLQRLNQKTQSNVNKEDVNDLSTAPQDVQSQEDISDEKIAGPPASEVETDTDETEIVSSSASGSQTPEVDDLEAIFMAAQAEYQASNAACQETKIIKAEIASDSCQAGERDQVQLESSPMMPDEQSQPQSEVVKANENIDGETIMESKTPKVKDSTKSADGEAIAKMTIDKAEAASSEEGSRSELAESSLRVDVALLDQLMNLVGELVLARNQILQFTKTQSDASFISTSQHLNLITSELQEGVMKTRMQPIANVWNKFPRVVRDVARGCGKEVRLEMEGKDTDLDKTIIEAIKDPLTHLVRNAVDHGIELPEERKSAGKTAEGCLLLRAFHEGGHVIIEISDDGHGLDPAKLLAKAIEKGILTKDQARQMSEQEILRLIFKPGFSTAEKVTNISGRGVGMDVVRSNIEKIGGNVDLASKLGEGTTVKIKIPLTLAIVPALIVTTNEQRFAIPQVSLVELLRVQGEQIDSEIEEISGNKFYRLRGDLLPLVFLREELKMRCKIEKDVQGAKEDQVISIVVVRADERMFGLVVDHVHDTEEIVVKPLSKQLKHIDVFAGATIMGDGRVALILDTLGLARRARIVEEMAERKSATESKTENAGDAKSDNEALLLVQVGQTGRLAIPLKAVNRLEEFSSKEMETAGDSQVVKYRGGIMPLVNLPQYFGQDSVNQAELKPVIVYSRGERNFGLIVDRILDIVADQVKVEGSNGKDGIVGSAIIQNQVTDLLDVNALLSASGQASE